MTALDALRVAEPMAILKLTVVLLFGTPLLKTRAVSGRPTVAPSATQRYGASTPMSEDDSVALSEVVTDFAGL